MKKSELYFNVIRLPVDFLMLIAAGISVYFLRTEILSAFRPVLFEFNLPFEKYLYLVFIVALIFVGSYAVSGLYSLKIRRGILDEFLKIIVASSAGIMILIVYIFLRQELFDSRFLILGGWLASILFVVVGRIAISLTQRYLVARKNFGISNVIVIGNDKQANLISEAINNNLSFGYRMIEQMTIPDINKIKEIKTSGVLDEVMLTDPNYPEDKILELVDFCHENHVVFKYIPNIHRILTANFGVDVISGLPMIELKRTRLDGWSKVLKRVLDILTSLIGLILLVPLWITVALAVKYDSRGPVFVRLKRISKNREFKLIKFRSMIENAEEIKASLAFFNERKDGPLFKIKDDPRITRIGKFIRKYRIDEFPQLWNILIGEISLVGPRPHQPDEVSLYQKHHKKVLAIKAGATGLAQVSGSSDLAFEREVALDTFYIENWSLWLDIKIVLKTIFKIFTDRTAA